VITSTIFAFLDMFIYLQIKFISFHVISIYFHIIVISLHYVYISSCCIHVPSCSSLITSIILKPIWCCVIDIMPYQKHHALPKKAKWQSSANAQQHAAALWKACSAGEASLAWQKALGVRTLCVGDRHGEISVVGGVPVECTGSAGTRPQRCKEGVRPALQGSHVVVVELAGENVALGVATARQLLGHVARHAGTVVDGLNIALTTGHQLAPGALQIELLLTEA
jgi:hypothetical protein